MSFSPESSIPVLTVFVQGLLSFFSPCVLPLVPLYVSYLSGGAVTRDENGTLHYPRKTILLNTLFFVLGISATFFVLGFGFTSLGRFFSSNRILFARISGILMVMFGLYQLGVFGHSALVEQERRLPLRLDRVAMNPFTALLLGFTFSFAWTPCVGPTLSSVLMMAGSASSSAAGFTLIAVYTLGFVLPFLAVGLFTGSVLDFFKSHGNVVRYTAKVGAVLLILMGIMTMTGFMNSLTGYLSSVGTNTTGESTASSQAVSSQPESASSQPEATASPDSGEEDALPVYPAPDFTLVDQYGETHTLSDYKGKTVFLNFWTTWCPPCQQEMPEIQELYESYGSNTGELIVLGVANPKSDDNPYGQDVSLEEVTAFLETNGYTFPVVMDTTTDVLMTYGISAFPTTFMIDKDGNLFGYVTGGLTADMMESIVQQTMTGIRTG